MCNLVIVPNKSNWTRLINFFFTFSFHLTQQLNKCLLKVEEIKIVKKTQHCTLPISFSIHDTIVHDKNPLNLLQENTCSRNALMKMITFFKNI